MRGPEKYAGGGRLAKIEGLIKELQGALNAALKQRQLASGPGDGGRRKGLEPSPGEGQGGVPFTLVGATTRSGLLTNPLRDRFGIPLRLEFYSAEELANIVNRTARLLNMPLAEDGALEIAKRSRGTPRIAGRLTRRVRDFAQAENAKSIDRTLVDGALKRLDVDGAGLDTMDRRYLSCIAENYGGGPVGVDTLAAALSEQRDMIEDVIEPYLLQQGLVQRTPRGRCLSNKGFVYLDLKPVQSDQDSLL